MEEMESAPKSYQAPNPVVRGRSDPGLPRTKVAAGPRTATCWETPWKTFLTMNMAAPIKTELNITRIFAKSKPASRLHLAYKGLKLKEG